MAQIVLIDTGTFRSGLNSIGDIVAVHEDNVELSGPGYANFKVIRAASITQKEVEDSINGIIPEQSRAFKTPANTNEWSFQEPETKEVWKNVDGQWCFLENRPKYAINMDLSQADLDELADPGITKIVKLQILTKAKEKISLDVANLTEAIDLNK